MSTEKFCLKWNDFQSNVSKSFKDLRDDPDFCDVTLASEGNQQIKAHKVILASSSPLFLEILKSNKHSHPLIYMRGIKAHDLAAIVDFIYHGEANIYQENLDAFLALAEELQLKGLAGNKENNEETYQATQQDKLSNSIKNVLPKNKMEPANDMHINYEQIGRPNTLEDDHKYSTVMVATLSSLDTIMKSDADLSNINEVLDTMIQRIDGVWTCSTCGKTTKLKGDIKRHAEIHIEGVSHPCNICGKVFRSSNVLRVHMQQKHT